LIHCSREAADGAVHITAGGADLMQCEGGSGVINILAADRLMNAPRLYATALLWLLSELFEQLAEVGDLGSILGGGGSRRRR
jgi:hypothetical protein